VHVYGTYESWEGDLLEFVVDEGADSFGEFFAVGPGGGGLPVEVYGHSIRTMRVVDRVFDRCKSYGYEKMVVVKL
jgi:hypothetical protein